MKTTLEQGVTRKISGFVNLVEKEKKDRKGRNLQTGETIGSRRILTFRPGSVMKGRINGEHSS